MTAACTTSALDFHSDDLAEQEACKAVCAGCELRVSCLAGAIARDEPAGVWGGESFPRVAMVVAHVRPAVYAPAHNRAHYMSGCRHADCLAANAAYIAQWRQQRAWSAPVVRETPPEQLDLFGQVTASGMVNA